MRRYVKNIRYTVQWSILLFIFYAGYEFHRFIKHFESDHLPLAIRIPSIEGFMPIGALMSLRLWLTNNIFDTIHPAALVIFVSALVISLLFKKAFCGWICPVGTLSEATFKIGRSLFTKNPLLNKYIDYPLRSIKYILMGFFIYIILIKMTNKELLSFLEQPYWKIADVKLLIFFTDMSITTGIVLIMLVFFSIIYKNFWCRYFCPYGALVGILSFISPFNINRYESYCIHCNKCTENCPNLLPVENKDILRSPECNGCLICVSVCPEKGALDISLPKRKPVHPLVFIALIITIFFGVTQYAKLSGYWESSVTYEEYRELIPNIEKYKHP